MTEDQPRRLTLLYQLYLAGTESRRFMRLALGETGMSGEEYAYYSYFYANGPRTLSQAAADLGFPITTLASLIAPAVERGDLVRGSHPTDGRARLLELSPAGRERIEAAIPSFRDAYRVLLQRLDEADADVEAIFDAIALLRSGLADASEMLEGEGSGSGRADRG